MRGKLIVLALAFGAVLPSEAVGQSDDCILNETPGSRAVYHNQNTDNAMAFIGGGARFTCPDGLRIQSDSVAYFGGSGIIDFIGRARLTDPDNRLSARHIRYLTDQRQIVATDDVILTDLATGSVITAPFMNYFQASDERPESLMQFPTGRPHAVMVRKTRADSARADTTIVDANAMTIVNQAEFTAQGNVEIVRDSVQGFGSEARFEQDGGGMILIGEARLVSPDYEMVGDTIDAQTDDNEDIREVEGRGNARLNAEDADVEAPRVRILFEEGEVSRLVAVANRDTTGTVTASDSLSRRARALSADFRLEADSIDAMAPGEVIESVTAVGSAYGERITADLANANLPPIAVTDWMRGDTIVATFAEDPDSPVDSTGSRKRVLERVLAVGVSDLATSFYRTTDDAAPNDPPSINYVRAVRIAVDLVGGKVANIQAEEQVHGLNLQPVQKTRTGGASTAGTGRSNR
jgi:lipopolysaccharide export system protein LptA